MIIIGHRGKRNSANYFGGSDAIQKIARTGIEVSILSMGDHEYLPDGQSRGFNEDLDIIETIKTSKIYQSYKKKLSEFCQEN